MLAIGSENLQTCESGPSANLRIGESANLRILDSCGVGLGGHHIYLIFTFRFTYVSSTAGKLLMEASGWLLLEAGTNRLVRQTLRQQSQLVPQLVRIRLSRALPSACSTGASWAYPVLDRRGLFFPRLKDALQPCGREALTWVAQTQGSLPYCFSMFFMLQLPTYL